jgi:hypothetical protein
VADQLKQVAHKLEQTNVKSSSETSERDPSPRKAEIRDDTQTDKFDPLTEIPEALTQEAESLLQNAIDQISASRADAPHPDQLYGWADSLQKVLGTTASAPTSEVRKLQDLIDQLQHLLQHK